VNSALELRGRLRSVNDKITYAAEVQSTLRQLLTESSGHRMELSKYMVHYALLVTHILSYSHHRAHRCRGRSGE
jgi:hypothetical protein